MAPELLLPNVVSKDGRYFSACIEIMSKCLWRSCAQLYARSGGCNDSFLLLPIEE